MYRRRQLNPSNMRGTRENFPIYKGGGNLPVYKGSRRFYGGAFYTAPSYMSGGGFIYRGARPRFQGGSIFGSLRSSLAPIGRQALQGLKTLSKNQTVRGIAKEAAKRGAELLTSVAVDTLQGRNAGESLKERSREIALRTLGVGDLQPVQVEQTPRTTQTRKRKRKKKAALPPKVLKQSKKRTKKQSRKAPPAKRRRQLSRASLNRKHLF